MSERQRERRAPREALEVLRAHADGTPWELGWERTFGLLRQFAREAEAAGARFLVLEIPLEEQVQRGAKVVAFDWASRHSAGVALDQILDWSLPERRLAEFYAKAKIDARQLAPALRAHAAAGTTPYTRDRHLNPLGHATAAGAVVRWWLEETPPLEEIGGDPVAWVPALDAAPASLDFRSAEHSRFLGDGWIRWHADAPAAPGGWRVGPRALAVLPDWGGSTVLRGNAGAAARYPLAVSLEVVGQRPRVVQISMPGPFEIRVPRSRGYERSETGYRVVLVGQAGALEADLRIQQLLVEPERATGGRNAR